MSVPEFVTVEDVATVDSGPAFKSAHFGEQGAGIRLLRGDNIEPGSLRWTRTKTWPLDLLEGYEHLAVHEGDLILGMDRPVISTGLKLARVTKADLPALLVQRVARIRPKNIDDRYLYYWLTSQEFMRHLQGSATGTQLPHVTLTSIKAFRVPRFGAESEGRIVDILEDHLSRLDAAESYLRNALKKLKALKASALASLHAGEPLPLGALAVDSGYGTSEKCVPNGLGAAVVRIPNLVDGQIDLSDEKRMLNAEADISAYMLAPGDVLIVRTNGSVDLIGRSAVVQPGIDAAFASYLIRYRVRDEVVRPRWVQIMLSTPQVRARIESLAASSAGQHNLSLSKLDRLELPVPSTTAQDAGIQRVVGIELDASRLAASIAATRSRAARLRSSILTAAFSGRLTAPKSHLSLNEELIGA